MIRIVGSVFQIGKVEWVKVIRITYGQFYCLIFTFTSYSEVLQIDPVYERVTVTCLDNGEIPAIKVYAE